MFDGRGYLWLASEDGELARVDRRTEHRLVVKVDDAARVATAGTDDRKRLVAALLLRRETALEPLDRGQPLDLQLRVGGEAQA